MTRQVSSRDAGAAFRACRTEPRAAGFLVTIRRVKPLAELTVDDLLDCPVWKFDLRAKVVMANEGRVMPRPRLSAKEWEESAGTLVVVVSRVVVLR